MPPADVWQSIATTDDIQTALTGAVRKLLANANRTRPLALYDAGVSALNGGYARLIADLDRARETDGHQRALELTAQFGQDGMTSLGHAPLTEIGDGPVALLAATDRTPMIAVRISQAFRDRPRRQRERTLSLLTMLGTACEVRIVCTGLTARWLAHEHRDQLPSSFSESLDARHSDDTTTEEIVETARAELDPDSRAVALLRDLAAEPAETLPYDELRAQQDVSASRVSQLLGELEDFNLLTRYGKRTDKRVELSNAGSVLLDTLDAEIGRQAELDCEFRNAGQSSSQAVYSRAHDTPRSTDDPSQPSATEADAPYRTRWLSRQDHAATAATAMNGGVTAVKAPIPEVADAEDRHTRFISYDDRRDEAVVAVRASGPLQYMTSTALALASPRFLDRALPIDRLENIDVSDHLLRGARCIGWLSEEAANNIDVLRDQLVEAGDQLASMTTDLKHGEYEDRDRFRAEILRLAQGLAGTIVHLLDVVGVELTRELRLPDHPSDQRLADLAETIALATAMQSKYGAFSIYRQVFEDRQEKRQTALSPEVDAADPVGSSIGGLVIRGPKAHRLGQHVEGQLTEPRPVHEDAPEITVRVPVTTPDRAAFGETATRMARTKSLTMTREAVTLLRALTNDPYAVAEALHWLGSEDRQREIRLDEVRVALSYLDGDRLLPDAPPTVSKAVAVLLRTAHPLRQSEVAAKADVSARSLRRYLDILEAVDLIRIVEGGYRFALPTSDDERGQRILPAAVDDDLAAPQDLLYDVALTLVGDPARLADPVDPLGRVFDWPPEISELQHHLGAIDPWIRIARTLCSAPDPAPVTIAVGPAVETTQTSLSTAGAPGGLHS